MLCLLAILGLLSCRGRRYPVSATPTHMLRICVNSHDDPLLSRGEHCSPAKKHEETFSLSYFSMTKSTKSHLRGFSSLLKNSFCRLAATGANTLPRPSRYSLATATGSKRLSADSDSLLCHVRLWRTSRELTDSRKRTRSASPRQGVQIWVRVCVRTWRDGVCFGNIL